jgi:methionyl-tRNA formyltransferase
MTPFKVVSIVVDNRGWFDQHAQILKVKLIALGVDCIICHSQSNIRQGDVAFFLSCTQITPEKILRRNTNNIVVHASDLPKGRGFSPLVWQILEGKRKVPVTMLKMTSNVDSGPILMQRTLNSMGHELNSELRGMLGKIIVSMCVDYVVDPLAFPPKKQKGEPSWYKRRHLMDSELDPEKTITEQFNLLRTVDNDKYPAFFWKNGFKYKIKIEKVDD